MWSVAVSYTHLDVYKRQLLTRVIADAVAEGLMERHQKPAEGEAEAAEPLAEWEVELLNADQAEAPAAEAEAAPAEAAEAPAAE